MIPVTVLGVRVRADAVKCELAVPINPKSFTLFTYIGRKLLFAVDAPKRCDECVRQGKSGCGDTADVRFDFIGPDAKQAAAQSPKA